MSCEVLEMLVELVRVAFGLVAALAWNPATQSLFTPVLPEERGLMAKFLYAITVAVIVIFATICVGRLSERAKEREQGLLAGSAAGVAPAT